MGVTRPFLRTEARVASWGGALSLFRRPNACPRLRRGIGLPLRGRNTGIPAWGNREPVCGGTWGLGLGLAGGACGGTWGLAPRGKLYGLLAYFTKPAYLNIV